MATMGRGAEGVYVGRARQGTTRLSANRLQYAYGEPVVVRAWLGGGATASDEPLTLTLIGAATGTRETPLARSTRYAGMLEAELRIAEQEDVQAHVGVEHHTGHVRECGDHRHMMRQAGHAMHLMPPPRHGRAGSGCACGRGDDHRRDRMFRPADAGFSACRVRGDRGTGQSSSAG